MNGSPRLPFSSCPHTYHCGMMAMNLSELHSCNSTMLGHDVDQNIHLGPELKSCPALDVYRDADVSWCWAII